MNAWIARTLLAALLCAGGPAMAQLAQYGYVVGTLEPAKSFLEKLDEPDKGKFLHYHIFLLTAANVEYEVVIDVNDVSPTKPLIYRIASLASQTSAELAANFGPVFAATSDFHLISNTQASFGPILTPDDAQKKAAGALDYLRHPGLLKAIRQLPWQSELAQTTSDPLQWALPALDAVFKPRVRPGQAASFTKVYVFGGPFTSGGHGMHVVHQNQADTGSTFSATNATWQDGGVIIERHSRVGRPPLLRWLVSRQVLMAKFANQTDFSAESNDPAHPAAPGHTVAPTVDTHAVGLICGDFQDFGPVAAAQLEVSTAAPSVEPDGPNSAPKIEVRVKKGPFTDLADPGDFTLLDNSTDPGDAGRAFGRAYAPIRLLRLPPRPGHPGGPAIALRANWYVRVHAIDPGSWCDSEVAATLKVSHH
jgi:hypothetical protein